MLATWHHSKDNTEIKTEEDNVINTLEQDESSAVTDTEKQPTVFEEAVLLFETIDKALINVSAQQHICRHRFHFYSGGSYRCVWMCALLECFKYIQLACLR